MIFCEDLEPIYEVVKKLPLYKQRAKEEVFLGILKSRSKKWIGWKYLRELKKDRSFNNSAVFIELYELALNYYWIKSQNDSIKYDNLIKNYKF